MLHSASTNASSMAVLSTKKSLASSLATSSLSLRSVQPHTAHTADDDTETKKTCKTLPDEYYDAFLSEQSKRRQPSSSEISSRTLPLNIISLTFTQSERSSR